MHKEAILDVSKLLSGGVLAKLFGIVSTMIFARILTKDQMAVFPAFLMLANFPSIVLTFGIFSTFMRELPSMFREDPARARSLVVTGSAIVFAGTVIVSGISLFWCDAIGRFVFKDDTSGWVIALFIPGYVAFVVSKIAEFVMGGRGQFAGMSVVQVLESLVRPVATIALYFTFGFKGVVIGLVVAQFVMAGVGFYYIRDVFAFPLPALYPVGKLVRESMPYYVGNYLSYLRGDGDVLLITMFLGPAALAEYFIAKNLYNNLMILQIAVDRVAVERLARFIRAPVFLEKISQLHVRISQTMIPFTLLVIAMAPYAIIVLAGAKYANSVWPSIILLVALLAQFVAIPVERAIFVEAPGLVRVYFAIFEVAVVLVVAALLVPVAGLMGVAAARAVSPVTGCIYGLWLLRRRIGLRLSFGSTARAAAAALPGTLLLLWFAPPAHSALAALAYSVPAAIAWCISFTILTSIFDRPLFNANLSWLLQQFQALRREKLVGK